MMWMVLHRDALLSPLISLVVGIIPDQSLILNKFQLPASLRQLLSATQKGAYDMIGVAQGSPLSPLSFLLTDTFSLISA